MWSAVCSLTSTADRLPGEKMMPGGGVMPSNARIMGQSASGQRDRNLRSDPWYSQNQRRKHLSSFSEQSVLRIPLLQGALVGHAALRFTRKKVEGCVVKMALCFPCWCFGDPQYQALFCWLSRLDPTLQPHPPFCHSRHNRTGCR
jgi:hypothetical protein